MQCDNRLFGGILAGPAIEIHQAGTSLNERTRGDHQAGENAVGADSRNDLGVWAISDPGLEVGIVASDFADIVGATDGANLGQDQVE